MQGRYRPFLARILCLDLTDGKAQGDGIAGETLFPASTSGTSSSAEPDSAAAGPASSPEKKPFRAKKLTNLADDPLSVVARRLSST